ncbi:protein kinase [Trichoderma barbatum]
MSKREHSPSIDGPQPEETSPSPSRPGLLTVIPLEATGLSVPDGYKERPNEQKYRLNTPYALLVYDKSQKQADSYGGTAESPVWRADVAPDQHDEITWQYHKPSWKFDVCRFAELAIYIYLRDPHASPCVRSQDAFLGVARIEIDPSRVSEEVSSQWLDVQDGTGQLRISLKYEDTNNQALKADDFNESSQTCKGSTGYSGEVVKKDTWQRYNTKTTPTVRRPKNTNHPFVAPLTLVFQSQEGLHLLSPTVRGGYLFHHLQSERRFNLERTRFYAAEIVCALEYLHDTRGIYSWLKPRNVLLDSLGHIVLCGASLFNPGPGSYDMPEYPAPEILLAQGLFKTADWWTLGIFLYEMLTGLPLFYDENSEEIRRKILNPGPVQISERLPPAARDIIMRLLDREPDHRLGAKGGASEVKAHPFFAEIDWAELLQQKYLTPLKPTLSSGHFIQHGVQKHLGSTLYEKIVEKHAEAQRMREDPEPESNFGLETDHDATLASKSDQTASIEEANNKGDDAWELVWEEVDPGELYFHDRSTGEKKAIPERVKTRKVAASPEIHNGPSTSKKQDALEAALEAGHDHIISQIVLEYGIDLNVRLFGYEITTPLEWAVDHRNLRLVQLLLDNGADVSFPGNEARVWDRNGPALVRAVATGNRKLVELLVLKAPNRVHLTSALGLAVDQRDVAMAQLLLANGARCDFEDRDRPLPQNGLEDGCHFYDISEPEEFMPPLVRAVKWGDVGMVRLLLQHGANANVGYHDLYTEEGVKYVRFQCGRVIELAMELKRYEMIKLLLAAGADINVPQPVWLVPGHSCDEVPRGFHQSIMRSLRAAAAAAKEID